jgi:glucosamine--fructose-6-phosphate aminotransferase (isomerizing)
MCGIVGYVGPRDGVPIVIEGLHQLEYRGYDSAGVAVLGRSGLRVHKAAGTIRRLEAGLPKRLRGSLCIGHTRWATHGPPSDVNAHPHTDASGRIAIVHNGIIENAAPLRQELTAAGVALVSDTDSEVLAHLIARTAGKSLLARVRAALRRISGTYGIAVISEDDPGCMIVARNGSPVVLGVGERQMYVASDTAALVQHTSKVVYLDDGELAMVRADGFETCTLEAVPTTKETATVSTTPEDYALGDYESFLMKEIHEQPQAVTRTLSGRIDARFQTAHLGGLQMSARDILDIRRIKILGCGSAYYAGRFGAHLIETLTRIPTDAEPASEFRYRNPVIQRDVQYIAVSQSGETFDTLAAVQEIRRKGGRVLGIVNVVGSTIARSCDGGVYLHAGPEVSVASTKTFTCTSVVFALIALHIGRVRDMGPSDGARLIEGLRGLPALIEKTLEQTGRVDQIAKGMAQAQHAFFIGRAGAYPIACEGAQKMKEVSYIHAEAYPAAELKHGPLALITPEAPTIAFVPHDDLLPKAISSIEEIRARGGPIILVTHAGKPELDALATDVIHVPRSVPELDPLLLNIPAQLLACYAAAALGRNIDRPRNLAKSVTVE